MQTINEYFLSKLKEQSINDYEPDINGKLTILFKQLTGIDLSDTFTKQDIRFSTDGRDVFHDYCFQYGAVIISSSKNGMIIEFLFNDEIKSIIPFQCHNCWVVVDDNMTLNTASFEWFIDFTDPDKTDAFYPFNGLKFTYTIHGNLEVTRKIVYKTITSIFTSMTQVDLNPDLFNYEQAFNLVLVPFFKQVPKSPETFYSVFNEYPRCMDIDIGAAKRFLELLWLQYNENAELLKSRLLLVEMGAI